MILSLHAMPCQSTHHHNLLQCFQQCAVDISTAGFRPIQNHIRTVFIFRDEICTTMQLIISVFLIPLQLNKRKNQQKSTSILSRPKGLQSELLFRTGGGLCKVAGHISADISGQKASHYRDMAVFILFIYNFLFYLAQRPPVGQGLLIHEVSRSHSTTHHRRQDSSGRVISRDLYLTTQNTTNYAPGGIRTHSLSRLAAIDLCHRPRGHWDRRIYNPCQGKNSANTGTGSADGVRMGCVRNQSVSIVCCSNRFNSYIDRQ